jgi:hypothetical protein
MSGIRKAVARPVDATHLSAGTTARRIGRIADERVPNRRNTEMQLQMRLQ